MKTLTKLSSMLTCLTLAAALPVFAQERPDFYGQPNLDRSAEVPAQGIEPVLVQLRTLEQNSPEFQSLIERAGLTVKGDRVLVDVVTSAQGGSLAAVSRTREWLPVDQLTQRAAAYISAYRPPVANSFGLIASEAEALMRTDLYAAVGLTGAGVHIVVLDEGFGGLSPDDYVHEEAGKVGMTQAVVPGESVHGTAMIEAIRDIAPGAEITAIRLDEELDVINATNMAIIRGADIIVCPLTWFGLPGHGAACEAAALAAANGVMWVNAAGNFGDRRYFEGEAIESVQFGSESYVDFGGDAYQYISGMSGGDKFRVHFATDSRMQLELYRWDGLSPDFVMVGQADSEAPEQVIAHEYEDGMWYFPMVRMLAPNGGKFRMFAVGGNLHFSDGQGSIANPVGNGVISVGAVHTSNYLGRPALEGYSSMGGGIFNLVLDFGGPTGCTTGTYGPQLFNGTSAASANVAGLLALQLADAALAKDPLNLLDRVNIGVCDIVFALVDEFESDSNPGQANLLETTSGGHTISPSGDQDWYRFTVEQESSLILAAQGCRITLTSDVDAYCMARDDMLVLSLIPTGEYRVCVTANAITEYELELVLYQGAPEQVTEMSPANGALIKGASASLEWNAVQGLGTINYVLEVSKSPTFDSLFAGAETSELTLEVTNDGTETLYWRVTARNEFGSAAASIVHSLDFVSETSSDNDADLTLNPVGSGISSVLSIDTPATAGNNGGDDDAAGCAGTQGAGSMTAMLAAIIGALTVIRMRRKQQA